MDVNDAPEAVGAEGRGEDLHVSSEHDQVGLLLLEDLLHLCERGGFGLGLLADGDVPEGHAVPLHEAAQVLVVGDHAGDVALELARPPAVEQVGQAVVLLAREQHDPLGHVGVADVPLHVELRGDVLEGGGEFVGAERERLGADLDAQEELARVEVGVLSRLDHRPAERRDEAGDGGHDADAVRARDGEDVSTHFEP